MTAPNTSALLAVNQDYYAIKLMCPRSTRQHDNEKTKDAYPTSAASRLPACVGTYLPRHILWTFAGLSTCKQTFGIGHHA